MTVILPPDLTTELVAVNVLLQSIGEAPVSTLDTSLSVDVATAVQTLNEINNQVQTKGWHWNREDDWAFIPDSSGEINLPSNYLWVANAYWTSNCSGPPIRTAERARKLYNRDTHSFVFTNSVSLDIVLKLEWEEMPEYARQAITQAAAEVFQVRNQGTAIVERVQEKAVQGAYALLEQREDEADEQNDVGGNVFVANTIYGGPRRRGR